MGQTYDVEFLVPVRTNLVASPAQYRSQIAEKELACLIGCGRHLASGAYFGRLRYDKAPMERRARLLNHLRLGTVIAGRERRPSGREMIEFCQRGETLRDLGD